MTPQLMKQAEFARHKGVSKGCVTNWKNAGLLVLAEGPGGKPMVDVVRTELKLNANIDPMRGRPSTGSESAPPAKAGDAPALPLSDGASVPAITLKRDDLADERIQHLREQRLGQAMKNAAAAGELVPVIEAERRVSEGGRAARERVQSWFRGVAEQLAAMSDVRTIMVLGEEGIDEVFAQLSRGAANGEFAGDEDEGELTAEEEAEMDAAADAVAAEG